VSLHNDGGGVTSSSSPLPHNVPHPFEPTAWVVPPLVRGAQEPPGPRDTCASSRDTGDGNHGRQTLILRFGGAWRSPAETALSERRRFRPPSPRSFFSWLLVPAAIRNPGIATRVVGQALHFPTYASPLGVLFCFYFRTLFAAWD